MEKIIKYIEDNNLKTKHRYRHYSYRRFYLYNMLRENGFTYYEIAELFNRDHASVIHGVRIHKDFMSMKDKIYMEHIDEVRLLFESFTTTFDLVNDVMNCYSLEKLKKIKYRIRNKMYI